MGQQEANTEELAKKTQNPVADLISVPLQSNFNFGAGTPDIQVVRGAQKQKIKIGQDLFGLPVIYQPKKHRDSDDPRAARASGLLRMGRVIGERYQVSDFVFWQTSYSVRNGHGFSQQSKEGCDENTPRMKIMGFCRAVFLILLTSSLAEAACVDDSLAQIEGQMLVAASGAVYQIINTNGANIAFWLPPAGLTICDQVDLSGQIYFTVSNKDANETVVTTRQR